MDNYQISYYTETLFPNSEFKTDEIVKEDTLSYGALVNDTYLAKCFRTLIAEDKYLLYDVIRKELNQTLKVTDVVLLIKHDYRKISETVCYI